MDVGGFSIWESWKTSGTTTLSAKSFRDGPFAIRYIQSCIRHSCMVRGEGDVWCSGNDFDKMQFMDPSLSVSFYV